MYQEAVSKVEKVITFAVLGSGPTWFHVIESRNGIVHFWHHGEVCCVRIYWLVSFIFPKNRRRGYVCFHASRWVQIMIDVPEMIVKNNQKQRVFVDFIAEAGTFREWIAGATVPADLQVSCVGNTQQKAGGELSSGDEMGVLNGKGAKRALCMILFCSSNRFICRGSSLRIRCAHLLAHIWLHAMACALARTVVVLDPTPGHHKAAVKTFIKILPPPLSSIGKKISKRYC